MDAVKHAECYHDVLADMKAAKREYFKLKAVAEYHRKKAGLAIGLPVDIHNPEPTTAGNRPRNTKRFSSSKQIDAAEAVLREAGRPLKTAEIAERMQREGFPMQSAKKLRNAIFTGMTRKPAVFKKLESGTWSLAALNGHASEALQKHATESKTVQ